MQDVSVVIVLLLNTTKIYTHGLGKLQWVDFGVPPSCCQKSVYHLTTKSPASAASTLYPELIYPYQCNLAPSKIVFFSSLIKHPQKQHKWTVS